MAIDPIRQNAEWIGGGGLDKVHRHQDDRHESGIDPHIMCLEHQVAAGSIGRQALVASADAFAAGLLPIVQTLQSAGASTLETITHAGVSRTGGAPPRPLYMAPHLRHLLKAYPKYYNEARTHLSLKRDAPIPRVAKTVGQTLDVPVLGGLHRQCIRA